jgi:cephalosporin hydroxylase
VRHLELPERARPVLRRGIQRAERSVAAAFVALVERQSRRGKLSGPLERAIADALSHVQMTARGRPRLKAPVVREVVDRFHILWYDDRNTWRRNTWQGHTTFKCPLDLWLYQEIIHAVRPGLVIETGTFFGGSATYLGWLLDTQGRGRVVSVDIDPRETPPHPRVSYITGSSTDPAIVADIKSQVPADEPVMVILDSDHSEQHVYAELQAYADLVTAGSYLIVEDTNINGHPANLRHGPGPMEAAQRFLSERSDFVVDEDKHRLHLTLNPKGYLRRIA